MTWLLDAGALQAFWGNLSYERTDKDLSWMVLNGRDNVFKATVASRNGMLAIAIPPPLQSINRDMHIYCLLFQKFWLLKDD